MPRISKSHPTRLVLSGRQEILPWSAQLEALAERTGQSAAMNWLFFFLHGKTAQHKHPYLVLEFASAVAPQVADPQQVPPRMLLSAVLLAEYRLFGIPSRAFMTADGVGFRTVIASAHRKRAVTAHALETIMEAGAHLGLVSFENAAGETELPSCLKRNDVEWAERTRTLHARLPLHSTLDDTLATMTKSTRFNMRYYRRRVERDLHPEFIPYAGHHIHREEWATLNDNSLNPFPWPEFERRMNAAVSLPGSFLIGLRAPNGQWLSLVGGWRQGTVTVLFFQINAAGYEKYSLSTAMRCFYIEHEIGIGMKELLTYGGTPHQMSRSFVPTQVQDVLIRRRSLWAALLMRLAPLGKASRAPLGRANFLGETLASGELRWQPAEQAFRPPGARLHNCS